MRFLFAEPELTSTANHRRQLRQFHHRLEGHGDHDSHSLTRRNYFEPAEHTEHVEGGKGKAAFLRHSACSAGNIGEITLRPAEHAEHASGCLRLIRTESGPGAKSAKKLWRLRATAANQEGRAQDPQSESGRFRHYHDADVVKQQEAVRAGIGDGGKRVPIPQHNIAGSVT